MIDAKEPVIRHRGGGRDEDGKLVADAPTTLLARAVAPGAGSERLERGRDGEDIVCTVYFHPGTDIGSADELTVRGKRFRIVVNDWHLDGVTPGGLEVACVRGQG